MARRFVENRNAKPIMVSIPSTPTRRCMRGCLPSSVGSDYFKTPTSAPKPSLFFWVEVFVKGRPYKDSRARFEKFVTCATFLQENRCFTASRSRETAAGKKNRGPRSG